MYFQVVAMSRLVVISSSSEITPLEPVLDNIQSNRSLGYKEARVSDSTECASRL